MGNIHIENEIKVIDIDVDVVVKKLSSLGFKPREIIKFKRYIFETPSREKNAWIRLRTDGKQATLTYKKVLTDNIDGVEEIEVSVNNFADTHDLLSAAGLKQLSYQENTRKSYLRDNVEVSIDSWPLIPPYLEIEAKTKDEVTETLKKLGLTKHKVTSLPAKDIYGLYGINIDDYKELRFRG